jgi:hypothetical protein
VVYVEDGNAYAKVVTGSGVLHATIFTARERDQYVEVTDGS